MKLVFDLQSLQTGGSRNRGIGRYSRALMHALISEGAGRHDMHLLLGRTLPALDEAVRAYLPALGANAVHLFDAPSPLVESDPANLWRIRAAEKIKAETVAQLNPDVFHMTSLFEGLVEDFVGLDPQGRMAMPTAVTLYDLIPYLRQDHYLAGAGCKKWYGRKIAALTKADLLLSISEASRQEAIAALGIAPEKIVTISTDADAVFSRRDLSPAQKEALCAKFGLTRPFVMYTGGIDMRKNIDGLIAAFAGLSKDVRKDRQLVIVCKVREDERAYLRALGKKMGLSEQDLVLTGFVTDEEMVALYSLCALFVFPSIHEGFGLPVLEAMRCGAPVIASNKTSLPEIVVWQEAMFDPCQKESLQNKMAQALQDEGFRQKLIENGAAQEKRFSWRESARRALDAFEALHDRKKAQAVPFCRTAAVGQTRQKPKLAYVSPVKPQKSGIADYGADLVPALSRYYDIDLVTTEKETTDFWMAANCKILSPEAFDRKAGRYDRILYHFGNSAFHATTFALLAKHPGTVVLHDFFMSGIRYYMQAQNLDPRCFEKSLYESHGYPALKAFYEEQPHILIGSYPCNADVLTRAMGVIVHSDYSGRLAEKWYGPACAAGWRKIPLLRSLCEPPARAEARARQKIPQDAFVVCSFGFLGETKRNEALLDAWLASALSKKENGYLIFVGQAPEAYESRLKKKMKQAGEAGKRVRLTGYASWEMYRDYLASADLAVQLREKSRGETSAAIADCLSHGVPLIVNAHGSAAETPTEGALLLPDVFSERELAQALEDLFKNEPRRHEMTAAGQAFARRELSPEKIAQTYHDAIETFAAEHRLAKRERLLKDLAPLAADASDIGVQDLADVARAAAQVFSAPRAPQLLVDVTVWALATENKKALLDEGALRALLLSSAPGAPRCEAVYFKNGSYFYARAACCALLGLANPLLDDEKIDVVQGDVLRLLAPGLDSPAHKAWLFAAEREGLTLEESVSGRAKAQA